jgi:RNA polymerase sigma factor (sigma-70 family)
MPPNERDRLIEENMGLVGSVIKDKVRGVGCVGLYDYDDLFQIGCIGLCKAADAYKPGRARFSTYAYILIRNEIMDALEYATLRRSREDVTAPEAMPGRAEPEAFDESIPELGRMLDDALARAGGVTAKGIDAIRLLAEGYTHREIGELIGGASANNVSAWVSRARKYLRSQPDIAALGELL